MKKTSARCLFPTLLVGFFFAMVQPAFALDMEFYTYNGFGPVSQAFTKIALIFSDGGYNGLFAAIIILGIIAAAFAFTIKSATGAKLMPLSWIWPIIGGVMIYLALFVPKGNITVYDPVLNRFQTIAGIPNGVVFTAGVLNKVERGLVDIIDTAGVPGSKYQEGAGGIGFTALKEAMNAPVKNNYLQQSLAQYVGDCVMFEMTLPGTTFSVDALTYTSTNFLTEFAKAANPAIYTVYFDDTFKAGATMTCADAWTGINLELSNPATYQESLKAVCGASLFNSDSVLELQQCKDLMTNTLFNQTGISAQPEDLVRQGFMTQIIYQVISKADPNVTMAMQGNRQIVTSGMGMASSLNEWLPIMRAIMTAIAIGLIPFLVLFIPTPLFGKGLGAMAGFFVFLTTWGIADAIVHGAALDYATVAMKDIQQSGLGLATCLNFPETSTKIMGMFGMIRGSSIMLASFLTTMLVKFGGHALAMMSGNLQGAVAGGGQAAARALTPEGHAQAKEQLINSASAEGWMNSNSFGQMSRAGMNAKNMSTQANTTALDAQYKEAQENGFKGNMQNFMAAKNMKGSYVDGAGTERTVMGNTGVSNASFAPDSRGISKQQFKGQDGTIITQYKSGDALAGTSITGADGKEEFTALKIANAPKLAVGRQIQNTNIHKGAEGMSDTNTFNKIMSYTGSTAEDKTRADSFNSAVSNAAAATRAKAIKDGSMTAHINNQEFAQAIQGGATVSVSASTPSIPLVAQGKAEAHASYNATITGKDGKTITQQISEEDAKTWQNTEQKIRTESIATTVQNQEHRAWAIQASKATGATSSASYLEEAQKRETDSAGYEASVLLAATNQLAREKFDGDTMQAADFINRTAHLPGTAERLSAYAQANMLDNGVDAKIAQVKEKTANKRAELGADSSVVAAGEAGNHQPTDGPFRQDDHEKVAPPDMTAGDKAQQQRKEDTWTALDNASTNPAAIAGGYASDGTISVVKNAAKLVKGGENKASGEGTKTSGPIPGGSTGGGSTPS